MNYEQLVEMYEKLESTTKRLEKTLALSEFLKKIPIDDLQHTILLVQGTVFPLWDSSKIGVASRIVLKAIATAVGISPEKVEADWKKTGDLGDSSEKLISTKKQHTLFSHKLTVKKVFNNIRALASLEGEGTVANKVSLIAELLTSAKPEEAKYIVRTVLEELRIGLGAGTMRDAIVWANFGKECEIEFDDKKKIMDIKNREKYNHYSEIVQKAYDLTNDFSVVAEKARKGEKELTKTEMTMGAPIKVMLALKATDIKDGFERVGKPAELEYKYDGFRMQIHKHANKITIFTRRLENVTVQFPEVAKYVLDNVKGENFILDSEAVGYDAKTKKYFSFQHISQRIKRKYDIEKLAKEMPIELNIFDILYYNGKNMINDKFSERRKLIDKIVKNVPYKIIAAKNLITSDEKTAEKFYKQSLSEGNEGIMFKTLDAPYKPGARVGYMLKLKPTLDTIDLVITGADWGEGKRSEWMSSFTVACIDEDNNFVDIGKVGTGIKEKTEEGVSFEELTELLKPLVISEKGKEVKVKPKIVVQIIYSEIQKSPTYGSGYALRFPRLSSIREDRSADEITTLSEIEDLFQGQKK